MVELATKVQFFLPTLAEKIVEAHTQATLAAAAAKVAQPTAPQKAPGNMTRFLV